MLFLPPNAFWRMGLPYWIAMFPGVKIYETRPVGELAILRYDPYAIPRP